VTTIKTRETTLAANSSINRRRYILSLDVEAAFFFYIKESRQMPGFFCYTTSSRRHQQAGFAIEGRTAHFAVLDNLNCILPQGALTLSQPKIFSS